MFGKITKYLSNLIISKDDPVYKCEVYKKLKCAHVDGMLCDMRTCSTLNSYLNPKHQPESECQPKQDEENAEVIED